MTTITIPTRFGYPTVDIKLNGKEYTFPSGVEIEMEDDLADIIENAIALAPSIGRNKSRLAQFVEGSITEVSREEIDGVTAISRCAFYNYDSLNSISVPNNVTSIGNEAFSDCGNLKSVEFGENSQLTSIGGYAFYKCVLLTNIEMPERVKNIGSNAFCGCTGLNRIVMKSLTPPSIQADTFLNVPTTCVYEVPSESLLAYKSALNWSTLANQIVATKE